MDTNDSLSLKTNSALRATAIDKQERILQSQGTKLIDGPAAGRSICTLQTHVFYNSIDINIPRNLALHLSNHPISCPNPDPIPPPRPRPPHDDFAKKSYPFPP